MEERRYQLIEATKKEKQKLIPYKLDTIFAYAKNLDEKEIEKIKNYVNRTIESEIEHYRIIKQNEMIIGCFMVKEYEDGFLLDEIYIDSPYRNQGIGSSILKEIIKTYHPIYLWVYKENERAIHLYKRFHFQIEKTTETRYLMKHEKTIQEFGVCKIKCVSEKTARFLSVIK